MKGGGLSGLFGESVKFVGLLHQIGLVTESAFEHHFVRLLLFSQYSNRHVLRTFFPTKREIDQSLFPGWSGDREDVLDRSLIVVRLSGDEGESHSRIDLAD